MRGRITSCVIAAVWTAASVVQAADIQVTVSTCDAESVEAGEIERIIRLETTSDALPVESVRIHVTCANDGTTIEAGVDDVSKTAIRTLQEAAENRVIALGAALLITSLIQEDSNVPEAEQTNVNGGPAETDNQQRVDIEKPWHVPMQQIDEPGEPFFVGAAGGIRSRSRLSIFTGTASIFGHIPLNMRLGLIIIGMFEGGHKQTRLGGVELLNGFGGLALSYRAVSRSRFALDGSIGALLGCITMNGNPSEDAGGSRLIGVSGDFYISVSPTVFIGRTSAAIDLKGGYALKSPIGHAGSEEITQGGFWIGADIRIGFGVIKG